MSETHTNTPAGTPAFDDCWNSIGVWRRGEARCDKLDDVIHCYNCPTYAVAGRSLLDRAAPEDYEQEWTNVLAREKLIQEKNLESVVVFRLGAEWLSLPVSMIGEITLMRDIFDLPHNHNPKLRGIVNIRGELVICMSLGFLIGVDRPDEGWLKADRSIQRLIMMREGSGYIVFPVSEVHGITRHHADELNIAPDTVKKKNLSFIKGIIKWQDHNVGCIDETALTAEIANNLR